MSRGSQQRYLKRIQRTPRHKTTFVDYTKCCHNNWRRRKRCSDILEQCDNKKICNIMHKKNMHHGWYKKNSWYHLYPVIRHLRSYIDFSYLRWFSLFQLSSENIPNVYSDTSKPIKRITDTERFSIYYVIIKNCLFLSN